MRFFSAPALALFWRARYGLTSSYGSHFPRELDRLVYWPEACESLECRGKMVKTSTRVEPTTSKITDEAPGPRDLVSAAIAAANYAEDGAVFNAPATGTSIR
jgi:hypothetical protein